VRENTPKSDKSAKFDLLSMKDYPLYLYLRDAQKFTMEKLVSIMEEVLEADIMMKSSSLGYYSPQTILENLILTICSPRGNERLNRSKDQR
jgi:DNA polymerase III delta subunit